MAFHFLFFQAWFLGPSSNVAMVTSPPTLMGYHTLTVLGVQDLLLHFLSVRWPKCMPDSLLEVLFIFQHAPWLIEHYGICPVRAHSLYGLTSSSSISLFSAASYILLCQWISNFFIRLYEFIAMNRHKLRCPAWVTSCIGKLPGNIDHHDEATLVSRCLVHLHIAHCNQWQSRETWTDSLVKGAANSTCWLEESRKSYSIYEVTGKTDVQKMFARPTTNADQYGCSLWSGIHQVLPPMALAVN